MATLATGSITGGVKRTSGVSVSQNVLQTWNNKVRSNEGATADFVVVGFSPPSSKTNVDVLEEGVGGLGELKRLLRARYNDVVCFGAFKDGDNGRFVHFMSTGEHAGVMAKGRASMAKSGVLNHLEGCVREITLDLSDFTDEDLISPNAASGAVAEGPSSSSSSSSSSTSSPETSMASLSTPLRTRTHVVAKYEQYFKVPRGLDLNDVAVVKEYGVKEGVLWITYSDGRKERIDSDGDEAFKYPHSTEVGIDADDAYRSSDDEEEEENRPDVAAAEENNS